jgi:hypothetical protein
MSHLLIAWIAGTVGFLLGGLWFALWDRRDRNRFRNLPHRAGHAACLQRSSRQ